MKFRVERDVLADAVAWAARTLPSRPSMPVLAGLVLTAEGEQLTLSSFDYEVSARVEMPAEVSDPGTVVVSGRLLADIARSLPAAPVVFDLSGTRVNITCGRSSFTLPTLPFEDYPSLPSMPTLAGTIDAAEFAHAVTSVAVAATRDDTLPTLTGIRMEIEGTTITLAATDRYRLAVRELSWVPSDPKISTNALVPARTLADTAKALANASAVSLALSSSGDGLIGLEGTAGDVSRRTTTRLLDGQFPPYRTLLPSESSAAAVVETALLSDALKRVALVAERNTPVRLSFDDGEVTLRAGTGEDAQAIEAVECAFTGDAIEIAFNPTYLGDGLGAVDAAFTRFSFTQPSKPAVLSGLEKADSKPSEEYKYLLMPVRLVG